MMQCTSVCATREEDTTICIIAHALLKWKQKQEEELTISGAGTSLALKKHLNSGTKKTARRTQGNKGRFGGLAMMSEV
jgi:hypothetical protein